MVLNYKKDGKEKMDRSRAVFDIFEEAV